MSKVGADYPCLKCGRVWTGHGACHCGECHRTFSSLSAFDKHRIAFACAEPATRGLIDRAGTWGLPGGWRPSQPATQPKVTA